MKRMNFPNRKKQRRESAIKRLRKAFQKATYDANTVKQERLLKAIRNTEKKI